MPRKKLPRKKLPKKGKGFKRTGFLRTRTLSLQMAEALAATRRRELPRARFGVLTVEPVQELRREQRELDNRRQAGHEVRLGGDQRVKAQEGLALLGGKRASKCTRRKRVDETGGARLVRCTSGNHVALVDRARSDRLGRLEKQAQPVGIDPVIDGVVFERPQTIFGGESSRRPWPR